MKTKHTWRTPLASALLVCLCAPGFAAPGTINYMNLYDHPGPSGVPLGGIGTGYFSIAPDGTINRAALNNPFAQQLIRDIHGSFFALYEHRLGENQRIVYRMARDNSRYGGMRAYKHTFYRGFYPCAGISYGMLQEGTREPEPETQVTLDAFSPIIPHNLKDSSLPVAFFEVRLHNPSGGEKDIAVAFSWEDLLGRQVIDVKDDSLFQKARSNGYWDLDGGMFAYRDRLPTFVGSWESERLKGMVMLLKQPILPRKDTFQNYITRLLLVAQKEPDLEISVLGGYEVGNPDAAWQAFRDNGRFPEKQFPERQLYDPAQGKEKAVALCIRTRLKGPEVRTLRFMVAWYMPKLDTARSGRHPFASFPSTDYNRYFHNYFENIERIAEYCDAHRQRLAEQTKAWHQPILRSTYPDWLKFKIINSGYVLTTSSILNQNGDFTIMEGGGFGFTGTLCQKIVSHPFLMKLFTVLERAENESAARAQNEDGAIPTFIGGVYHGLTNRKTGANPCAPGGKHLDSTGAWLILTAEDFQLTGNLAYLQQHKEVIRKCYAFLQSRMISDIQIPSGEASIDDYAAPPIFSYQASVYLAALNAIKLLAQALGETVLYAEADQQFQRASKDFVKYLWNGQFFSYGCNGDGSNERRKTMFTGQLVGQFLNRYLHWPDLVPFKMVKASAEAQIKTSVASSPEYYAPKVFDLDSSRGLDHPNSRCWPFYLEAGTAMLAFQAGRIEDCHRIMASIQKMHAALGYSWSQNLWEPGELAYMSAPVSWFMTDLLVSGGFDKGAKTLFLSPVLDKRYPRTLLPFYFPGFWGEVECAQDTKEMTLNILECFDPDIEIDRIAVEKPGTASADREYIHLTPLRVKKGLRINLSEHWDKLAFFPVLPCILDDPGRVLLDSVPNPYRTQ